MLLVAANMPSLPSREPTERREMRPVSKYVEIAPYISLGPGESRRVCPDHESRPPEWRAVIREWPDDGGAVVAVGHGTTRGEAERIAWKRAATCFERLLSKGPPARYCGVTLVARLAGKGSLRCTVERRR